MECGWFEVSFSVVDKVSAQWVHIVNPHAWEVLPFEAVLCDIGI